MRESNDTTEHKYFLKNVILSRRHTRRVIRRSPRSAKIARCARCRDCNFHRSPRSAYKITRSVFKPAIHLHGDLYADRGEFDRRLMRTHLAIFFADRGDEAVLKTHVLKSPNLMGWLYWRFAAINVENRGTGTLNRR